MNYVFAFSVSLNIILFLMCRHWMNETLFWRRHTNTGPVYAHWIDDQTWRCGGCGNLNGYSMHHCRSCQRQRLNYFGDAAP